MAHTVICIKTFDSILNYGVYSKQAAPVNFEGSWHCLSLRKDPCTNKTQYFIISGSGKDINTSTRNDECNSYCEHQRDNDSYRQCDKQTPQPISFILLNVNCKITQKLPSNIAYCCFQEFFHSRTFRKRFIRYMKQNCKMYDMTHYVCMCEDVFNIISCALQVPLFIEICLDVNLPVIHVCLAWCYRIEGLARKRLILEETMAWLSTLGGGYSSLGDYFLSFSQQAGKISVTQLNIAIEMGDPIMASKCRMFFALSLMQAGKLKHCKKMLRNEYEVAIQYIHRDSKLIDMCKGMWSKLQYYYMKRRTISANNRNIKYKDSNLSCYYVCKDRLTDIKDTNFSVGS
ncbi:hypothetical protein ACF0H5_016834 [Mactra antiquata]